MDTFVVPYDRRTEVWYVEYEEECKRWQDTVALFSSCNITRRHCVEDAFREFARRINGPAGMFSLRRPTIRDCKMVYVKEYIIGTYRNIFSFCKKIKSPALEEVIYPMAATRIYFALTLQRHEWPETIVDDGHEDVTWVRIVDGVLEQALVDSVIAKSGKRMSRLPGRFHLLDMNPREIDARRSKITRALVKDYFDFSSQEWDEDQCFKGHAIMKDFIETQLATMLQGVDEVDTVSLSGSDRDNFRARLLCSKLYCESSILSMPLLVHELARSFVMENARWLFEHLCDAGEKTTEYKFRVRAMKVHTLASVSWKRTNFKDTFEVSQNRDEEGDIQFFYLGFGDTPFDEEAYGFVRSAGAPGSADDEGNKFRPLVNHGQPWISGGEATFEEDEDGGKLGLSRWMRHLICPPLDPLEEYCLVSDVRPSDSFAEKSRWDVLSRRIPAFVAESSGGFHQVTLREEARYVETRPRQAWLTVQVDEYKGEEELYRWNPSGTGGTYGRSTAVEGPWQEILPDHLLKTESGGLKAFKDCDEGDWFFHCSNGQGADRPDARVFDGGFWCTACRLAFTDAATSPWEEPYPFTCDETVASPDPKAYLPDLDWGVLLDKKYVVIEAPMGSGKTRQLEGLLKKLEVLHGAGNYSFLVVSFRQMLSQQQARRLGIVCYLEVENGELQTNPALLTICLNSITKLSKTATYDYVILDECGLIRRHFVGSTMGLYTKDAHTALAGLQKRSKNVVLLQEGITMEDVQFFTEAENIDCDNRNKVSPCCFVKPIEIHPIEYTTDHSAAVANLVEQYKLSFEMTDTGLVCKYPCMVFCSNAKMCEILVRLLSKTADEIGAEKNRVKGLWASMKKVSDFCKAFSISPNEAASEADVVICSSMIGAGFSVEKHFQRFFAFLYTNILNFDEEKQFIQRLRFKMKHLPMNAMRQSYIYIQLGHGHIHDYKKVFVAFQRARRLLLNETARRTGLLSNVQGVPALERTQARLAVETAATRSLHFPLWAEYGIRNFISAFLHMDPDKEERLKAWGRKLIFETKKEFNGDILSYSLLGDDVDGAAAIAHLETGGGTGLLLAARAESASQTMDAAFAMYQQLAKYLMFIYFDPKKSARLIAGTSGFSNWSAKVNSIITWLTWTFGSLNPEVSIPYFTRIQMGAYKKSAMKNLCHFKVATAILPHVLGIASGRDKPSYISRTGESPFYANAEIFVNEDLLRTLEGLLVSTADDTPAIREQKNELKNDTMFFLNGYDKSETKFREVYTNENACRTFLKKVLHHIGLDTPTCKKRRIIDGRKVTMLTVGSYKTNLLFALCTKQRSHLVSILHVILDSGHISQDDSATIRETIQEFTEACAACQVEPNLPFVARIPNIARHTMTATRMQETARNNEVVDGMGDEYEDDHAEDEDPPPEGANEDEGSDVEAQEMTVGMDAYHSAIALVRLDDRRSEARRFAGTVVGEVVESCANDESDDDDDDDESENDPHRPRNQHVDDEADHD
jgi:hypothetical protein